MEIIEDKKGEILILELNGRLDTITSNNLEKRFLSVLDREEKKVVVDCSKLEYVSSAGLRVLLMVSKRLRVSNGKIVLSSLKDQVKEVFDIAGFSPIFTMFHSLDEAVRWFE
jgi:anti-anti-sigma factor